jgi:hypothetical protein
MNRRVLLGILGWLAVAATATGAGVAAIGVLEDGITGSRVRPLDSEAVRRDLSRTGVVSTPPAPGAFPSASPTGGGVTRNLAADGGTVNARCDGGRVTIMAWTPAQGYQADDLDRGPAVAATLTFKSDRLEYAVTVTCEAGAPVAHSEKDDGHHGRHGRHGGHG